MRRFRLWKAFALAFVMGVPMANEAKAEDALDIVAASLALAFSIIDVAGDS